MQNDYAAPVGLNFRGGIIDPAQNLQKTQIFDWANRQRCASGAFVMG